MDISDADSCNARDAVTLPLLVNAALTNDEAREGRAVEIAAAMTAGGAFQLPSAGSRPEQALLGDVRAAPAYWGRSGGADAQERSAVFRRFGAAAMTVPELTAVRRLPCVTRSSRRETGRSAGVGPVGGRLEATHNKGRNYFKGRHGDQANTAPVATGYKCILLRKCLAAFGASSSPRSPRRRPSHTERGERWQLFSNDWRLCHVSCSMVVRRLSGGIREMEQYDRPSVSGSVKRDGRDDEAEARRLTHQLALRSVAAFVSHELNHPLGTIANLIALLERRIHQPVVRPSEMSRHFDAVKQEIRRAADVIRQLRILGGGLSGHTDTVTCSEFLREVVSRLRRRYTRTAVATRVECPDRELAMECAAGLLHIALYNLLINGIEAMQSAGVKKPRLRLRALALEDRVAIDVIDVGPGVDLALSDRIFEPLVSSKTGGSGLGLAIARDIAEWHGGRISWLTMSPPSVGARFRIELKRVHGGISCGARS